MEWIVEAETMNDVLNGHMVTFKRLIRCKDCKFYRFYDGVFGNGWMCFENNTARHGDDYCSRGEWKDNEIQS